jgi:hypothetical protein
VSYVALGKPSLQPDATQKPDSQNLADSVDSELASQPIPFATYPIAIGGLVFLCCNFYWFRKRLFRCFRRRQGAENSQKREEENVEEISDVWHDLQSARRVGPGMDSRARRYMLQAEAVQGPDTGTDSSSNGIEDEDVIYSSSQPPAHEPLSLVIRPPNIMTGDKTAAGAPDETLLPPTLALGPPNRAKEDLPPEGAFDTASAPPRAPAVLSYVDLQADPSPVRMLGVDMVELHASAGSGHSMSTRDGEESAGGEPASQGLLDATGYFKLNSASITPSGRRSTLAPDDLAPLFDMVAMVADGETERHVDGQGVREILDSLLSAPDNGSVSALYARLGREVNSRLTLEELREGWASVHQSPSAKSDAELGRGLRVGETESFDLSFDLQRPASTGSWDSDS